MKYVIWNIKNFYVVENLSFFGKKLPKLQIMKISDSSPGTLNSLKKKQQI